MQSVVLPAKNGNPIKYCGCFMCVKEGWMHHQFFFGVGISKQYADKLRDPKVQRVVGSLVHYVTFVLPRFAV